MRSPARLTLALLLALTGAVAACGDDGEAAEGDEPDAATFAPVDLPPEAEPYVDALVVELTSEPTMPIPDDQARCIAGRMVQVFRVERLEAAGVEPDRLTEGDLVFEGLELTEDEGLKLVDAFQQCDFDLYDAIVDSMAFGAPDEGEARRCIQASLSREDLRQSMARGLLAEDDAIDDPEMDAISQAMFACLFDEDFPFEEVEGEL